MSDPNGSQAVGKNLADLQAVGDAARQVGDQARQAGTDALGHVQEVARDAQNRAASLASELGNRATATAETQKESLAGQLEGIAQAVHRTGEQLEGQQDWLAHLVEQGADELGGLASMLRSNDLQSLFGGLQSLARRQPALFVGASMAAGFALTRVGRVAVTGAAKPDMPSERQIPSTPEVPGERN